MLGNVPGLTGNLLSTVVSEVSSLLGAAGITRVGNGGEQTGIVSAVAGGATALVGTGLNGASGIVSAGIGGISGITASIGNGGFSVAAGGVTAMIGSSIVATVAESFTPVVGTIVSVVASQATATNENGGTGIVSTAFGGASGATALVGTPVSVAFGQTTAPALGGFNTAPTLGGFNVGLSNPVWIYEFYWWCYRLLPCLLLLWLEVLLSLLLPFQEVLLL
jgi:hypothetical protein